MVPSHFDIVHQCNRQIDGQTDICNTCRTVIKLTPEQKFMYTLDSLFKVILCLVLS